MLEKPLKCHVSDKQAVRRRLADVAPHLGQLDTVQHPLWLNGEYFKVQSLRPHSLRGCLSSQHSMTLAQATLGHLRLIRSHQSRILLQSKT